ncbi:PREDICTED: DNA repair protein complementing XP-C cells homolog [Fragaria vesca subsp. vesca]
MRSKKESASASGSLGELSEEAVAKLVRRANRGGKKKFESQLHPSDLIGKHEPGPQRDKKDVDARVASNALETEVCSRDALRKVSRDTNGDEESFQCSFMDSREELNDSDWEDGPVPISNSMGGHEVTIEINETPDSRRRKRSRRASVEDKEVAELVHKAHLLCLIARGRLIDRACDDALIQASLLSLLPEHLLRVSKVAKLTVKHLLPLVFWFQNNFRVRTTSVRRSFHLALNFALETREGTQEEIAALSVALFRALNLTTRLVSVLNVASLKPEADKTDWSSEDASRLSKGIFSTATPMVARKNVPVSPATSSERNSVGETPQIGSYKYTLACEEWNDISEACHTKKSKELKRRGDLEFEMQMQMALSATAVPTADIKLGSDNNDSDSNVAKRLKRTVCEESQFSSQSISTAVGSRKEGSPLYWAEVYCNGENLTGKWLHIDAINAIIDGEQKVEAVAAACKTPLRYVVAFAGNGAKDVTRRYCLKWYQIASQRVDPIWWDQVLAPLRDLEVRATGGMVFLEKEHTGSSSEHIIENFLNISGSAEMSTPVPSNVHLNAKSSLEGSKDSGKGLGVESSSRSVEIATRNSLEEMELETRSLTEPLPTNQQAYKNHHLYAIEKWLTKHQVLHPKGPILGFCSGHPVYPRTCVQTLKSKHKWLREGLQVKPNEHPVKELKRSIKVQKVLEDDGIVGGNSIATIELYGKWQLEPLHLPHAINGKVPKNDHGNVEVWSEKCLPPGTVYLRLPRVFSVAKRLEIDYAPAMVDFEFKNGQSYPVFDGIVVCAEFKDAILEAYAEERDRREAVEKKKYEMQAISRWYQLLSSIVTRQRIQNRYGESAFTVSAETENVSKLDVKLGGGNDEEALGCQQGLHKNTLDDRSSMLENHEHVFLTENQSFDKDNLVVTKRCLCGFSVQVEEL